MSELRFDGRAAVVTGAGCGIGAAHARLLAARGAAVVVNDLHAEAAATVVAEIETAGGRALGIPADVSTEAGAGAVVDAAVDRFGRVDIVVNNAGVLASAPFADMTVDLWDRVVGVNLRSTFLVTHRAWPHFVAQGFGRVVSTSSNSGLLGVAGSSAYSASKAAIWGLTRTLALEGAEFGINVNAIAPIAYTTMSATSKIAPPAWRSGEGDAWSRRLDPARVAPVVAWLGHHTCTVTGRVFSTAGGRVARFGMWLGEGTDRLDLTPEHIAEHVDQLLADPPTAEYGSAAEEAVALHRRLMPRHGT